MYEPVKPVFAEILNAVSPASVREPRKRSGVVAFPPATPLVEAAAPSTASTPGSKSGFGSGTPLPTAVTADAA
jgi:hypothetical protein